MRKRSREGGEALSLAAQPPPGEILRRITDVAAPREIDILIAKRENGVVHLQNCSWLKMDVSGWCGREAESGLATAAPLSLTASFLR